MKKNIRTVLCLLMALVLTFQLAGSLAWADDNVNVTGNEALVYALYLSDGAGAPTLVSAEQEAELLGGKTYSLAMVPTDSAQASNVSLSRTPGSAVLNSLLKADLVITPPEGFYVSQAYLRGDSLDSGKAKTLPFSANKESPVLTLKAGALSAKDESTGAEVFDKEALSSYSADESPIYTVVVVLSPVEAEDAITVTEALDANASGTDINVMPGESYVAADAPADTAEHKFSGWKLSYKNGATLLLNPGESFKPYADCRVEAQWTEIITITANPPIQDGDGFVPNSYTASGKLADGDSITGVELNISEEDGRYVSTPSAATIENDGKDVTDRYELRYIPSEAALKNEEPAPIVKTELTITAREPITNDGGATYVQNGALLTEGALNEGDEIVDIAFDVKQNEDGSFISVPRDAVIKNGETDNTANYDITYVPSAAVTPPAPEKVKLTITAREPITNDDGKTYVQNGAVLTEGALNEGDSIVDIAFDVKQNEDGSFVSVPRDAVVKNGETDNTANYDITYIPSPAVTPPAEKTAITIRSKDRTAEYTGQTITANEYEIVSGALADGDSIEVRYDGGTANVTSSPVAGTIASVVIKDSAGNDVTESKYAVTIDNENAGKITVTKHSITVTAITGTVETDGTKVINASECKTANGSFNKGYKAEGLLSGHALSGNFVKGSGKETFTTSIDLNELRVIDTTNGNTDVTANYDVKTVNGTLTIKVSTKTGVPVALTTRDQSWSYDGAAHKPDQSGYNISGLLDGDVATVSLQIKQGDSQVEEVTNAGSYTIVPVVSIRTKDGSPVDSSKYNITAANATLTVNKLDITLEAISDSKPYDGKALVNDKVKAPSLPSGQKYQVKLNVFDAKGNLIKNGAKEVGTYTKKITEVHIVDAKGVEVTDNFNITKVDGKLTITPSSLNDSTSPKTGDYSDNTLYIILIIASVLLLGTIVTFLILQSRKKKVNTPQPEYDDAYFEPDETGADWQQPELPEDWNPNVPEDGWKDR